MSETPNMSSQSSTPASGPQDPSLPTSVFPTPFGSPKSKKLPLLPRKVTIINPALVRSDKSFTRAVSNALKPHKDSSDPIEPVASTVPNSPTEQVIKNDTSSSTETVRPELLPIKFPAPEWPHFLAKPSPRTKAAFLGDIAYEIRKVVSLKSGLKTYIQHIHSEQYHVFDQAFLTSQIEHTNRLQAELNQYETQLRQIENEAKEVSTAAGTVLNARMDQAELNQYYILTWDDPVSVQLVDRYDAIKPLVHEIRKFFIGAHVWYKVNYALCPDKTRLGNAETEEGTRLDATEHGKGEEKDHKKV